MLQENKHNKSEDSWKASLLSPDQLNESAFLKSKELTSSLWLKLPVP